MRIAHEKDLTLIQVLPQAQISTGFPYGSFFSTSGERQPGVPAKPVHDNGHDDDGDDEVDDVDDDHDGV